MLRPPLAGVYHRLMSYLLAKAIGTLLTPGVLLLAGLVIGAGLLWTRRHWRIGRRLLTAWAVVFTLAVVSPLQPFLTRSLENRFPANPPLPPHIHGIIILGGAIDQYISEGRHQISLTDASERLIDGAIMAKAHPEAEVVVTGGSADPSRPDPSESPFAATLLEELGVAANRVVIENQSRNTYENAVFSQRQVNPKPGQAWVLITSARHMPRAVGVFRHVGWRVIPWPVDYTSGGGTEWSNLDIPVLRLRLLAQALHEWVGLAFYRLSGWTDALFPGP